MILFTHENFFNSIFVFQSSTKVIHLMHENSHKTTV